MINRQAAQYSVQCARMILTEATHLCAQEAWNLVVRRCQEAVELALEKARFVLVHVERLVADGQENVQ